VGTERNIDMGAIPRIPSGTAEEWSAKLGELRLRIAKNAGIRVGELLRLTDKEIKSLPVSKSDVSTYLYLTHRHCNEIT